MTLEPMGGVGEQRGRGGTRHAQKVEARLLRELLDEAHARIRTPEKAIERLTAAV